MDVPAELFDPDTETFSAVTSVADARRYGDRAHVLSNGQVLLLGGETPEPGGMPLADGRPADSVLLLPDDTLLLFGGRTLAQAATSEARRWNADGAQPVAALPAPRRMATAHRLPDGRVLIVGGGDAADENVASLLVYE